MLDLLKEEERRRRMPNHDFFTSRCAYINLRYIIESVDSISGDERDSP